jgi:uncharacterized protein (TIGR02444 family)
VSEGFWDFSVRTYRTEGVPDACLSLQNDYGADVNMLLYCCWIGACVGKFEEGLFDDASAFSTHWADNVVRPLRSARTWMKHSGCSAEPIPTESCMELREEIKSAEFASEKLQQQVLESLVSDEKRSSDVAEERLRHVVANLTLYAEYSGFEKCEDVRGKLAIMICAAFPDLDVTNVARALDL